MGVTTIEWTERSVNPIRARHIATGKVGHYCERISPGCASCYASSFQRRFGTPEFVAGQKRGEYELFLDDTKLNEVLKRKKPTTYFWVDMSDLFGEWVPEDWIDKCFAVMAATPHHTHQVLTKRAERMKQYLDATYMPGGVWPLPNVWCGVSVENQEQSVLRIKHLARTKAAIRFLSVEPLLGPIHFGCTCFTCDNSEPGGGICRSCGKLAAWRGIDLAIFGGESGHRARPCEVDWIRSGVRQCREVGMAVFVKQLGSYVIDRRSVGIHSYIDEAECWPYGQATDGKGRIILKHRKGGDMEEWPSDLRIRELPKGFAHANQPSGNS